MPSRGTKPRSLILTLPPNPDTQKNDGPSQPPCALGPPEGVFDCALLSPKIALSPSLLLCERTSPLARFLRR